jgi:hypothetical protein
MYLDFRYRGDPILEQSCSNFKNGGLKNGIEGGMDDNFKKQNANGDFCGGIHWCNCFDLLQ